MHVTRTIDYAVRSLIYLSIHGCGDLSNIAQHQRIPQSYLAKVMNRLARSGLVHSTVGRDGGYRLRMPPDKITLREIFEAVEGKFSLFDCYQGSEECFFIDRNCTLKGFWNNLEERIRQVLDETTLADILPQNCLLEDFHEPAETATSSDQRPARGY